MNIHFALVAGSPRRLSATEAKRIGLTIRSGKGTEKPRTRPGQTYPCGRPLRKRFAKLSARTAMFNALPKQGQTAPGSMAA